MKKIFLLAMLATFSLKSQSTKETVDFINDALKESTKSAIEWLSLDQLKVNEKGKIIDDVYMDLGQPQYALMESRIGYLKNLTYSETKYFKEQDGTSHYVIILKCRDGSNCISRQVKGQEQVGNVGEIAITLYNKEISEKVKNAIIHLLTQAINNKDFLTKDPF